MKKKAHLTNHGKYRSKERAGLRKGEAQKKSQEALSRGITHKEAYGSLKKYIDFLYLSKMKANNIRVYQQKVYLFRGKTLITMLNLPEKFNDIVDDILEKRAQSAG
jgi:hypothetical protein